MSLIGDISLTNKQGVFLGSVNLSNLNANAGDIVYSPDGFDLSGLALSDGLSSNGSQISTIGNPNIQLTSNSIYVNDNQSTIQSAVDSVSQADAIYISSGSFNENVVINNKQNISLICPATNSSTICEILNGLVVSGTSVNVRVSNITIKGSSSSLSGTGRNIYSNMNFIGTSSQTHVVTIGANTTDYITFTDCGFNQYVNIIVPNTFLNTIYFINCNFGGASISLNNVVSPLQVIFNNCAGFSSLPSELVSTRIGMNVLTTGESECSTQKLNRIKSFILQDGTNTLDSSNLALTTNGVSGWKLSAIPDSFLRYIGTHFGQYAGTSTGNPLTLLQVVSQANIIPNRPAIFQFNFNLEISGGADTLTLELFDDGNVQTLNTLDYELESGKQNVSGAFNFTLPSDYTLNFSVRAFLGTHNVSITPSMNYFMLLQEN